MSHKLGCVGEEDAGVCLQVHFLSLSNDFKTFDCDICLVRQTETYEVQHLAKNWQHESLSVNRKPLYIYVPSCRDKRSTNA